MIVVKPYKGNYTNGYHIKGHAGYAKHGQDIVCAAVSALAQSCLLSLERYATVEKHVDSGNMDIRVPEPNMYTQLLINSMVNGLIQIERTYDYNAFLQVEKEQSHERTR